MLSHPSLDLRPTGTMVSSDFSSDILQDFALRLIPSVTIVVGYRPNETSPPEYHSGVPSSAVTTSRTPYTGEPALSEVEVFLTAAFPGSSPLLLPSPCVTGSALSCSPCGDNPSLRSGQAMSVLQGLS